VAATGGPARIEVRGLTISVEGRVVQRDLDFEVATGQIFAVIGDGGSGRSLLLRTMAGIQPPMAGEVLYDGESLWRGSEQDRDRLRHRFGILFQGAVMISEMTLLENVAVKLRLNTTLSDREADEVAALKLAIMGLRGYEKHYPSQVSEGMRIRAALARATSLDPDILFFDDPSALLDPLHSRRVDDIILGLRDATGATIVLVSHDLQSIFALADYALFLDGEKKTMVARGRPQELRDHCSDPKVRAFLTRGAA
jgi:phospholipid/cholesterol/gamma-HCH transport system ATP-binding protein